MKDWCEYKSLEAETQREMRRAHQAYIQDTVNQDLTANSKRFYSYVKSKKQETTGISPLLNQDGFLQSQHQQGRDPKSPVPVCLYQGESHKHPGYGTK